MDSFNFAMDCCSSKGNTGRALFFLLLSIQNTNAYSVLLTLSLHQGIGHKNGRCSRLSSTTSSSSSYEGVDMSRRADRKYWPSSLPLPENAVDDPELAQRAKQAMEGSDPPALEGRCAVNLDYETKTQSSSDETTNSSVQWLHVDPPVLIVDDFLTESECDKVLQLTTQQLPPDAGRVIRLNSKVNSEKKRDKDKPQARQSTTWYVRYGCKALAPLFYELSNLLPRIQLNQIEEVQLVRYAGPGQGFAWHEDAIDDRIANEESGGQRVATVLVYLDDVVDGDGLDECILSSLPSSGRTMFRDLLGTDGEPLAVAPKRGRALLFFPAITSLGGDCHADDDDNDTFGSMNAFDGTRPDHRMMHAGEPPDDANVTHGQQGRNKHIAQVWIHSRQHTPVVFGRGLNNHADAQKHIDLLKSRP